MADKGNTGNRSDDFDERVSGAGDEEIRGIANDEDDEFDDDADDLDEEEDEEGTAF
jgi:hypothetical protein